MSQAPLEEHFFRHEYGRLVSVLTCRMGVSHLQDIEDAVQSALVRALEHWPRHGEPENPSAWLYRVAHNQLMDGFRKLTNRRELLEKNALERDEETPEPQAYLNQEIEDDVLRLLFACCDDALNQKARLILALKVLCGFDVREIALGLFQKEATVYKTLKRSRQRLQNNQFELRDLTTQQYEQRLPAVHQICYLLFTEGYLSNREESAIRKELCEEAIRLTTILAKNQFGKRPETFALLALMHFHSARMSARLDPSGGLLLLEEQNRKRWNYSQIQHGLMWLAKSSEGDHFSRYHAEAGIAAEHCLSPTFEDTNWERVVDCYELLEKRHPSAIHKLNRAIAIAEWKGPEIALNVLQGFEPPSWLTGSYLWPAVLADLYRRNSDNERFVHYRNQALELAPNQAVRSLLQKRLIE